jgi:hypothetical protein
MKSFLQALNAVSPTDETTKGHVSKDGMCFHLQVKQKALKISKSPTFHTSFNNNTVLVALFNYCKLHTLACIVISPKNVTVFKQWAELWHPTDAH